MQTSNSRRWGIGISIIVHLTPHICGAVLESAYTLSHPNLLSTAIRSRRHDPDWVPPDKGRRSHHLAALAQCPQESVACAGSFVMARTWQLSR
jgi:hypothetical protein